MGQSILSEYGVIGSLLIDSALFPEASGLSEDDFTLVPLREVFRAMRRQFAENGSFDALTVRAEAGQHCPEVTDKLLLESMEITPTTANLTVYVSAVKEASLSRKLAVLGNELVSSGRTPAEALSHARTVIQKLVEDGGAGEATTVADALNALCDRVERQAEGESPLRSLWPCRIGQTAGRRLHQRWVTYHRRKARCRQIRPCLANRTERRQNWDEGCLCLA